MSRLWIGCGAISGFLAVALGAFGAHGLSARLSEKALSLWHTAAQYQMYHALALLALGVWTQVTPNLSTAVPGWSFVAGSVIFCGSLYALALTDIRILGAVTPVGGLAFLIGWLTVGLTAMGVMGGGRSF